MRTYIIGNVGMGQPEGVELSLNRPERIGMCTAYVAVPSSIRTALTSVAQATDGTITAHFTVFNDAGRPAVHDGFVVIDPGET